MSDRIAIFSDGQIEQLGNGEDLYDRPASLFVADFIGESNILRGHYEADGADGGWMTRGTTRWRIAQTAVEQAALEAGAPAALVIRPERTRIVEAGSDAEPGSNVVDATVGEVLNLGPDTKYELTLEDGQRVAVREPRERNGRELRRGDPVRLTWTVEDGLLLADRATPDTVIGDAAEVAGLDG